MFRLAVILVHALIFIFITLIGLTGKYNPALPDPDATYGLWFLTFTIFNILVLVSAFVQFKIKKLGFFIIHNWFNCSVCFDLTIHISLRLQSFGLT